MLNVGCSKYCIKRRMIYGLLYYCADSLGRKLASFD